jgi:hypothetical protein
LRWKVFTDGAGHRIDDEDPIAATLCVVGTQTAAGSASSATGHAGAVVTAGVATAENHNRSRIAADPRGFRRGKRQREVVERRVAAIAERTSPQEFRAAGA